MAEILSIVLMFIGTVFILIAGVGLLRMPDMFLRMSAATKAGTVGTGFILLAASIDFADLGVSSRAISIIAFLFLTAPVGAHMIGRAAYFTNIPLWKGTLYDELGGRVPNQEEEEQVRNESRV